ncbi:MAG: autotransporter domain-containing protein [Candidatus Accumulibacter propinquus]|jgi:outer membrane lipase/esterase
MDRRQGCMRLRGGVLAALLCGVAAGTQAGDQSYSNLYFFGDSITDSGTFRPLVGPDARFTTKPGTVWAENLGANYGKSVTPAYAVYPATPPGFALNASGNNLAVGDARVNAPPPNNPQAVNLPSVAMQVDGFLARGPVDRQALYAVWAGGNDVFAQFVPAPGAPLPNGQANIAAAANDLTAQVSRLQAAGARKLIVIGAMDMTRSPYGLSLVNPADKAQLDALMTTFNGSLTAGLAGRNLLYFDMLKLTSTILVNPLAYGFTDTTTPACPGNPPNALTCEVPANGHMYADQRHPSTLFHKVISDWVYASLEGASRVGLLSLVPIGRSGAQWRSIDDRLQQFENFGYQGQGFFVTGDQASSRQDAHDGLPSAHGSGGSFVIGYEKAFSEQLFGGVTLGYGNAPFDLGNDQGTVKYDEWALSAFAAHKFGAFYASALATWSWLDFESKRNVVLGPFSSSERGNTRGGQFGVKGQIGYNFFSGNLVHGPLAALAWERVRVDGFSEQSNSATAMTFGGQTRASLRSRLGWQVAAETDWSGTRLRPYAQLTYDYEHDDHQHSYRAGFVGGPTAMDMPISNQNGGYGTLLAGVNAELGKSLRLGLGASTTIAQPGARSSAINVTLSAPF